MLGVWCGNSIMIHKFIIIVLTFMAAISVALIALSVSLPKNMNHKIHYESKHIGIATGVSDWKISLNIGTDMENILLWLIFSQRTSSLTYSYRIEPQSSYKLSSNFAGFGFSRVIERVRTPFGIPGNLEQAHSSSTSVKFPSWFPIVLFGFYPVLAFYRGQLLRYRRRKGLCIKCGYNLTGNTTGICSECGEGI